MNADAVISWAVQTGLVVSLLILAILLIRRPFSRAFGASATYALWSLPLIRLCLPVIAIPQSWLPGRFQPQSELSAPVNSDAVYGPTEELAAYSGQPVTSTSTLDMAGQTVSAFSWTPYILSLWLGVAGLWLALQLFRQRAFLNRMHRSSTVITSALEQESCHAATVAGLSKIPTVRQSEDNIGPFVTGVFNPTVIVPANFAQDYDPDQRHYALVHEFAHIKRRDLWAALAALIFRAINWFNPLVHYAAHKMRIDQESACDAFVIARTAKSGGTKLGYAKTLLQAARTNGSKITDGHLALSLLQLEEKENSDV